MRNPLRSFSGTAACFFALMLVVFSAPWSAAEEPGSTAVRAGRAAHADLAVPAGVRLVTSVEGISEYLLESNGLRILLFPDATKQTMTVNVTYLVGSRHENYGETGMAHLLEHLLFKGSKDHPNIPAELTAHGCRPNGSTWLDRTNYFETFAASEENLRWALDLESDRMVNSFIAKKDLDSEMSVVRNEFERGENDPGSVLDERVVSTAYLWHNYGKSTIGCRADIENVPIERLQAFYRMWYQPDNAVLVVGGRIDPRHTLELVAEKFGRIPRPERSLPVTYTVEPPQDGERTVTLRRVGESQVYKLAYHIPAGSHPDFAAVEVLSHVLGDTPSGRLHRALVESRLATGVSAWAMQFHDPGLIMIHCDARKDAATDEIRRELIRVAEEVAAKPPSMEEVERAKVSLLKDWGLAMRDTERSAIHLSEWAALGDWRLLFLHRDRLRQVTPEAVQKVAASYLRESNRTFGVFLPADAPRRTEVPATPDLASMLGDYQSDEGLLAGEEFDASPANIEKSLVRATVAPGLKLLMLPKKTRGGTVNVSLSLRLGNADALRNQAYVAQLTHQMLMRGTAKHTRQELRDAIDALQARLRVGGGGEGWRGMGGSSADNLRGSAECSRQNLPEALRLMAEIARTPSFPEQELAQLKEDNIRGLEEERTEPASRAGERLQRYLYPWPQEDVRYVATTEEKIAGLQAVTREQILAFHRDFYGASEGVLVVVGDFDPKEIESVVRREFEGWTCRTPVERLLTDYAAISPVTEIIETPEKESASMIAGARLPVKDSDPDYPALTLANFMTGGGFLNSRLATRLRQKEGFSYGVGSYFFATPFTSNGVFGAFAIYAPQNREGLDRAFREELAKVVQSGFSEEEIAAAKTGWLQQRTVSRSSDRELASTISMRADEGRDLLWDEAVEGKVAGLTAEEINAAARRHFSPDAISVVHAGDFARVAQAKVPAGDPPVQKSQALGR